MFSNVLFHIIKRLVRYWRGINLRLYRWARDKDLEGNIRHCNIAIIYFPCICIMSVIEVIALLFTTPIIIQVVSSGVLLISLAILAKIISIYFTT